jgi:hypothetical protein
VNPEVSSKLREASRAAYPDRLHSFELWRPNDIDPFYGDNCSGFVASNREMVVVTSSAAHTLTWIASIALLHPFANGLLTLIMRRTLGVITGCTGVLIRNWSRHTVMLSN